MNTMNSDQTSSTDRYRIMKLMAYWVRAFWPLFLMVGAGSTLFRQAVIASIESTPYPVMVYTIFGVLAITALLAARALSRFVREERLAVDLRSLDDDERLDLMENLGWKSEMLPVYETVLKPDVNRGLHALQQKIETELFGCEERLLSRLDLPGYLGGSLVGIGLVGTFVGLLGSLTDLAAVFSSLTGTGGASSDPAVMFNEMMLKLQQPMKGMGTAFVASLYGLLGSLITGLVLQSVRSTGNTAVTRVRELLRSLEERFSETSGPVSTARTASGQEAMERLLMTMQQERVALAGGLDLFSVAISRHADLLDLLTRRVDLNSVQVEELGRLLAELRDAGRLGTEPESGSKPFGKAWLAVSGAVITGACIGGLATSALTLRGASQLNDQLAVLVRIAQQQVQAMEARGPVSAERSAPRQQSRMADSTYVVVSHDNLTSIAHRHGLRLKGLLKANPDLYDPHRLHVGQKIHIP
jgi:hypothetical protein